jgi:hypothetical protein
LLAAGQESKERIIDREFDRINETVRKDLANYSSLHRSLSESIGRIEKDHQEAVDVPPDPPGWVKAVQAVATIESREGHGMIGNILSDIHKSLVKAHKEALTAYHEASAKRHQLLRHMRPDWRQIQQTLVAVGKNVDSLLSRSVTIDRHMQEYEDIVAGQDRAISVLSSSSLVNFFVSAFVLCIAIGGATINFSLIARPMAEMVGGTSLIGGFRTADIAALVIILVTVAIEVVEYLAGYVGAVKRRIRDQAHRCGCFLGHRVSGQRTHSLRPVAEFTFTDTSTDSQQQLDRVLAGTRQ